ncbi:MAG: hypothetical protein JOZ90_17320 [Alphaproteobacteria bacterium]|nr:hypothetical protein [Alphaproteobacteria bacterium]MBV9371229.1 hypothetical protein [Alphaproteobacteria bacterium]MBV9902832.1 hypothetical protein [Alphaproteobacteria bacterium]
MTNDSGGASNRNGASEPVKDRNGPAGDRVEGQEPSSGPSGAGVDTDAEPGPAIDLDTAHDRAS